MDMAVKTANPAAAFLAAWAAAEDVSTTTAPRTPMLEITALETAMQT